MPVTNFVPLPGSKHTLLASTRPAGPIDQSETASLTVRTRPVTTLDQHENKLSTMYAQPLGERTYLSREQLADLQSALPEDLDAVEQYAQQHNLVVSHRSPA